MAEIEDTIDIFCLDDFRLEMPIVVGFDALLQRIVRRLSTPTGRFPFWPNFGFDVRQAILSKQASGFIVQMVQAQCLEDEQVESCVATLTKTSPTDWALDIAITTADGPFAFTMGISEAKENLTVKLREAA